MSILPKVIFVVLLGLVLAGGALVLEGQSSAAAVPGAAPAVQGEAPVLEEAPLAPEADRLRELVDLRTDTSKTYELADGKREWVGYLEPVHFKDASGAYREIDNSLVKDPATLDGVDYTYRNGANAYTVRFAKETHPSRLARMELKGMALSFGLKGARSSEGVRTADTKSRVLSEETYGESLIIYPDALPGIDLVYQPRATGLKEFIVLRRPGTPNEFTFNLVLEGLSMKQAGGQLSFVDSEGHPVFRLGELAAFDGAEAWTNEVTYQVKESRDACQLTVSVARAYLDDPAREYPVVIDPTIDLWTPTADTYISSANPSTNYSSSSYLRTGRDSPYGIRRSFLKFDQINDLTIDGDDVTSAYLRIEKYSGVTPDINAWWSLDYFVCTSMTWNSGTPHWDGTSSDRYGSPESTTATNDSGNWWRMYVTTAVRYWLNGTCPNYGWMIKDTRETNSSIWTTFYASNAGSPHRPELHIVYAETYDEVNITNIRTVFSGTNYAPGTPEQSISVSVRYTADSGKSIRLRIYDRGQGVNVASLTWTPSAAGTYTWSPSWVWKPTPDSYQVVAEHQATLGGEWTTDDSVIGSVTADIGGSNHGWYDWSPNQYTWGYKSNETSSYVDYYQRYWYWNDTWYPSSRGSERLYYLNHDPNSSNPEFQHEFRRMISVSDRGACDGWDAVYLVGGVRELYGVQSNLPYPVYDPYICEEYNLGDPDEEAEVKTSATESMHTLGGDDPTNACYSTNAYYTRFTFYRVWDRVGVTFLMATEFEIKHGLFDIHFDYQTATKHYHTF